MVRMHRKRNSEGIEVRHRRTCRTHDDGRCNCEPTYRASVWSPREGKLIRKSAKDYNVIKTWRQDAVVAVRQGTMRAPSPVTLEEAAKAWLKGAKEGLIRTRSGDIYKPAAVRGYEQNLRLRVYPTLGRVRLTDVRRTDLQDLIDKLVAEGLAPPTVQGAILPLRAIYRRAANRGEVPDNPTTGLYLPAVRSRRDRIATPAEATKLIAALPVRDRAVWATAFYAGLRRGELRALRVGDLDLDNNIIRVERGWDDIEGEQDNKSRRRRNVPIPAVLREHLLEHLMREGRRGRPQAFVFGETDATTFDPRRLSDRADRAWERAKLDRITLHDGRHTFASLMIAAGVNAKALSTYIGHASIQTTYDHYGHLMPGNEEEAASLLDAYLTSATGMEAR
jgi:integrase